MGQLWFVYILQCSDNSLYTGVTTDIARRLKEHNGTVSGAKYTRMRQPVRLMYEETCTGRGEAQKREAQIKKMSRVEKLELCMS